MTHHWSVIVCRLCLALCAVCLLVGIGCVIEFNWHVLPRFEDEQRVQEIGVIALFAAGIVPREVAEYWR